MIFRGFRYKLQPSAEQEALFRQFAGVCRLVYNLALEQRRDWWKHYERETGSKLTYVAQARELTALRAAYDWIAGVSQTCQQQRCATSIRPSPNSSPAALAIPRHVARASTTASASKGARC